MLNLPALLWANESTNFFDKIYNSENFSQHTQEIKLQDIPLKIRGEIRDAVNWIEERSFEGTDYMAYVEGIYLVFKRVEDQAPSGYMVIGYGSGEPDYNESMAFGFDMGGKLVFEDILDW